MTKCSDCHYAEWDYETFYGTTAKQWFICGCQKGLDDPEGGECDEYEEMRHEYEQRNLRNLPPQPAPVDE